MLFTIIEETLAKENQYFIIFLREKAICNESIGDYIGISKDDECLWFCDDLNIYDQETIDFIENYFNNCIGVALFIQKVLTDEK